MLLNAYAAQCAKCYKWRFIQSQEEYSRIRSRSPFECNNCEEPEVDVLCNWSTISCLLGGSHPFILKRDIKSSSDVLPFQNGEATKKRKGDMREETVERNMKKEYAAKKQVEPVIIEEIDKGKIDGKVATQGKKVSIYYTGKVKGRGKLFDSNIGEAPLRFRLGGEKVIRGMRVGDKRRLIIPPLLGRGIEGVCA